MKKVQNLDVYFSTLSHSILSWIRTMIFYDKKNVNKYVRGIPPFGRNDKILIINRRRARCTILNCFLCIAPFFSLAK